ncbi:MAG: 50S ribosomal protein L6 [Nanoarchaeota archaeon]
MSTKIKVPAGLQAHTAADKITVIGPNGTVERKYPVRNITIKAHGAEIEVSAEKKMLENTFVAHIENMFRGAQTSFTYKLKVAYIHFPMTVEIKNGELVVTNFLGERRQRKAKLLKGVDVKIEGEIITVSSPDIELAGRTASLIENLTRISNRDRRTFLDGIYMIEKLGVPVTA